VAWADKFRFEQTASASAPTSWMLDLFRSTRALRVLTYPFAALNKAVSNLHIPLPSRFRSAKRASGPPSPIADASWLGFIIASTGYAAWKVYEYLSATLGLSDIFSAFGYGFMTLARVVVLIALATLIWVPVGVWIGLRPKLAERIQPLAQFLAAFPANLLFPVFVVVIVKFNLNPDIWLSPLIVLGTQWYILFNVIAGATSYPNDYREAATNFQIKGWQWWRQAILPGIFPYYVTGAITASGGAWNASIVAEAVSWGNTKIVAHGLGAYIAESTANGDYPKIILGIAVMSLFVTLFNRLLWRPLFAYAEARLRLD
jgi:NitT/TauT family transport system permease protein